MPFQVQFSWPGQTWWYALIRYHRTSTRTGMNFSCCKIKCYLSEYLRIYRCLHQEESVRHHLTVTYTTLPSCTCHRRPRVVRPSVDSDRLFASLPSSFSFHFQQINFFADVSFAPAHLPTCIKINSRNWLLIIEIETKDKVKSNQNIAMHLKA